MLSLWASGAFLNVLTRATSYRVGRVPGPEAARITTLHHLPGFWARLVSREAQGEEPDSG